MVVYLSALQISAGFLNVFGTRQVAGARSREVEEGGGKGWGRWWRQNR